MLPLRRPTLAMWTLPDSRFVAPVTLETPARLRLRKMKLIYAFQECRYGATIGLIMEGVGKHLYA